MTIMQIKIILEKYIYYIYYMQINIIMKLNYLPCEMCVCVYISNHIYTPNISM